MGRAVNTGGEESKPWQLSRMFRRPTTNRVLVLFSSVTKTKLVVSWCWCCVFVELEVCSVQERHRIASDVRWRIRTPHAPHNLEIQTRRALAAPLTPPQQPTPNTQHPPTDQGRTRVTWRRRADHPKVRFPYLPSLHLCCAPSIPGGCSGASK